MEKERFFRFGLILPEIKEFLAKRNKEELREILSEFEPVEIAEAIEELSLSERVILFSLLDLETSAEIFEKMEREEQISLLKSISREKGADILEEVSPDERADLFAELPSQLVKKLFSIMEKEEEEETKSLLLYPPNSAGGQMTTEFATISEETAVQEAMNMLRQNGKEIEMIYYLYIIDKDKRLVGVVSLRELVLAQPFQKMKEIMHPEPISVPLELDQEEVAKEIARYDLIALPVIDKERRIKGIITVDDVIDVIKEENTEDMYKFGAAGEPENYLDQRPVRTAKHRLTWLIILALMSFFSGAIISRYSDSLSKIIPLVFFIPLLMNVAGSAGTQSATVVVRGLATGEVKLRNVWRVVKKEFLVGIIMGMALSLIGLFRALFQQKMLLLGCAVGLSMIVTVTFATTLGSTLPILFKKMKLDPAVISGPLITTILDISTLLIYFEISRHFLSALL